MPISKTIKEKEKSRKNKRNDPLSISLSSCSQLYKDCHLYHPEGLLLLLLQLSLCIYHAQKCQCQLPVAVSKKEREEGTGAFNSVCSIALFCFFFSFSLFILKRDAKKTKQKQPSGRKEKAQQNSSYIQQTLPAIPSNATTITQRKYSLHCHPSIERTVYIIFIITNYIFSLSLSPPLQLTAVCASFNSRKVASSLLLLGLEKKRKKEHDPSIYFCQRRTIQHTKNEEGGQKHAIVAVVVVAHTITLLTVMAA
jgi:hypothetical protein